MRGDETIVPVAAVALMVFVASWVAAWGTHIIVCILTHQWLLLIAGAIVFPVGIVHGYSIWFGVW